MPVERALIDFAVVAKTVEQVRAREYLAGILGQNASGS